MSSYIIILLVYICISCLKAFPPHVPEEPAGRVELTERLPSSPVYALDEILKVLLVGQNVRDLF